MSFSVGLVSDSVVSVGLVSFRVVWCRINVGLVSFSVGLVSDKCRISVVLSAICVG